MGKNDEWAGKSREILKDKNIRMVNIIGSPGCGKTTLLETVSKSDDFDLRFAVLEGDVETANDAERLNALNVEVSQLITSGGCHLEAKMINAALTDLNLDDLDLVIVENVGNLVCPAEFDIGEHAKIAVLSVTEGEDKPVKYPHLFRESKAVLLTKVDLLPYLPFDIDKCIDYIRQVNANVPIFRIASIKNEGIKEFITWLKQDTY